MLYIYLIAVYILISNLLIYSHIYAIAFVLDLE